MSNKATYKTKIATLRERIVGALASLLLLPVLLSIPLAIIDKYLTPSAAFVVAWLIACYVVAIYLAWRTFNNKETIELVPEEVSAEQSQAEKQAAEESERKAAEFFNKRWVRYPLGIGLLLGAGYLYGEHQNQWLMPLLMGFLGVLALREFLLAGIGIGILWLLVQGIASLPISLAIVLGAVIIALAVKN